MLTGSLPDVTRRPGRLLLALAAATALLGIAPAASSAITRVGGNFPLQTPDRNPIRGRDALGLAVNPNNSRHIVAVWQDLTTQFCEVGTSFNEGRTWRRTRLKAPAGFISPACQVGNHLGSQLNGGIAFGRGDTVYATFASGDFNSPNEPRGQSVLVAKSTDGGRTFSTPVIALRGGQSPDPPEGTGPDYVLPQIAVRRGGRGRADRVYVSAGSQERNPAGPGRLENVVLAVSSGGSEWSAPRVANSNTQNGIEGSQPALGPDGRLHIAYRVRGRGTRPGQFVPEGDMVSATSRDDGKTWERTVTAGVRGYVFEGPPQATGPFANTRSFTASTFPALTADPRSGDLYLVYGNGGQPTPPGQAQASDHFINPDQDVYFQRSTDGGRSWARAERINRGLAIPTERLTQTRHPNVTVAPNGRVDIVWHDRRHWYRGCPHTHSACDEARLGDTYLRSSSNGGRSFGSERRITHRSINNDVGYDYRFGTYWDYGPRAVSLGDNRLLVGWMDSLLGNVEDDTQDIFLAKVNTRASSRSPIPTTRLVRRDASAVSLALSRTAYPGGGEAVLADTFATRPATSVVIVNERDVAGALAGGVLARANLGPVLVSPAGGLPDTVKDEVARLAPVGAFIIGGEGSLSPRVAADLAETGIPPAGIRRLAGNNAADTARLIANVADRRKANEQGQPAFNAAIVVNPASRDAVTASVLAANRRLPVLLVGQNTVPAETASALQSLNIRRTLVIGDEEAVGPEVLQRVPGGQRLGGSTAIRTARAVLAESRRRGVPRNVVYSVPRSNQMDAAVVGAAAGRAGGLLMLSPSGAKETAALLRDLGMHSTVDRLIMVRRSR